MGVGLSTGGGVFEAAALADGLPGLGAEAYPGSQGVPIRNPYREVVSIGFSQVEDFTTWARSSLWLGRRLLSGWLFPIPLVFDVGEAFCGVGGFSAGLALLGVLGWWWGVGLAGGAWAACV